MYLNADSGDYEPVFYEDNQGLEAEPSEIHLLPDVAEIGDFGEVTALAYNNGWTEVGTWTLESSTFGYANIVVTKALYDSFHNLMSTGEMTSKINDMGEPVYVTYFQNDLLNGVVFSFSGAVN